jgi:hypothetical protein
MNNEKMIITKASGHQVPYSSNKLEKSLRKAGVDNLTIKYVISEVEKELYPGITTRKIYKKAFSILKVKKLRPVAARYKLKEAIMELGPSGFPFERYIGEIFKYLGYKVKVGQIVQGHCVNHEVDVIAEDDTRILFIECKYHQSSGLSCDVKVPLYINSRFQDIEKQSRKNPDNNKKEHQGWLVTNTKFTTDAIQYGNCSGLHLLGWDYPAKNNLRELIDQSGLHPLTALTTISRSDKQKLLFMKIVLCQEINENILRSIGFPVNRINEVIDECNKLSR